MLKNSQQTDLILFKSIQAGDEKAFDTFFKKHYVALCTYGKQYVGLEAAEGIAQEVMIWLWQNREVLILESSPLSYLYKSVKNRCITLLNHQKMQQDVFSHIKEDMDKDYELLDTMDLEKLTYKLTQSIKNLPETYREAFTLSRFGHLTYKEIAAQLDVSPKTVDYRIQQALKKLRVELKDYLTFLLFIL